MQPRGIDDVTDFLAKPIGNPIKTDFQGLDDGLLLSENLALLPTLAQTLAQGLLDRDFFGVDEVGHVVLFLKVYQLFAEKQGLGFWQAHHPGDEPAGLIDGFFA